MKGTMKLVHTLSLVRKQIALLLHINDKKLRKPTFHDALF